MDEGRKFGFYIGKNHCEIGAFFLASDLTFDPCNGRYPLHIFNAVVAAIRKYSNQRIAYSEGSRYCSDLYDLSAGR